MSGTSPEAVVKDQYKPCPACGEGIRLTALKCRICGEDLVAYAEKLDAATEKTFFHGHPAILPGVGHFAWVVLTLGLAWLGYFYRSRSVTYIITSHRIVVETGLLSKRRRNLELYRVDDLELDRPFLQRLLGCGTVILHSSDRDQPILALRGVEDADLLFEKLRDCAKSERSRAGIKTLTEA